MTKEVAIERLKHTDACDSELCRALDIAIKSLEKDIKQDTCNSEDKTEVIFSSSCVHYELRNKTHNYQMVTPFYNQHSQEGIRSWFKENRLSADFPEGKYVIVKVTETEKVEVVEELEG